MVFFEQSSAFGRVVKSAVAIAFATVLLIPAIGVGGKFDNDAMILPFASAQFSFVNPNENNTNTSQGNVSSTITTNNNLLLRGLIGSMISTNTTSNGGVITTGEYTVAGRWRMFANESLVQRFVANLTVAKTDGSEYHQILIENIGGHSEFARNNNNISSSHMNVQISADSAGNGIVIPVTVEIRGDNKVLRISDIAINQGQIEDGKQRDILRIIDGQLIYGIVMSVE